MNDLPKDKQPQSADPDYWDVWTGKDPDGNPVVRKPNWKAVADDWSGAGAGTEPAAADGEENDPDLDF